MTPGLKLEDFHLRYEPDLNSGCWLWNGYKNAFGYGVLRFRGHKSHKAHRASYRLHVGEIPSGLVVMHKCDTPACVNPSHLSVGTRLDNIRDCVSKGRARGGSNAGEKHPLSVLKREDVEAIFSMFDQGLSRKQIAERMPVTRGQISGILRGRNWRNVYRERRGLSV